MLFEKRPLWGCEVGDMTMMPQNHNYMWKMSIRKVYGAGIRNHNLQNICLLPKPLDQGSRLGSYFLGFWHHTNIEWTTSKSGQI